jgi:hypothetical protein
MRRCFVLLAVCAVALALAGAVLATAHQSVPATPVAVPNCRLGYAAVRRDPSNYPITDITRLDAGQWIIWGVSAGYPQPAGAELFQMVRLHQNKICGAYNCPYTVPYTYTMWPSAATIAAVAQAQPGALWLIGNEIDRRDWPGGRQDEMLPELYAVAFHEIHGLIKNADPTARIAIAGMIQATPLRLQYLDRIWNEYVRLYGTPMPVDIWNIHGFIFREKRYYDGCPDCYGADVPPGIDVPNGILYEMQDSINMTYFGNHLVAFRQWLASHGQRDKPLLVTEYGALPEDYYPPGAAVNHAVTNTLAYMRDTRDTTIGYPGDDNRLVQRWVVYSLDDDVNATPLIVGDPGSFHLSAMGTAWANYVANPANGFNPRTPSLHFRTLHTDPAVLFSPTGGPITATLYPQVDNSGNISTTVGFSVRLTDSQSPLNGLSYFDPLDGCGQRATGSGVVFSGMLPGVHIVTVHINSPFGGADSQVRLVVATRRVFLPVAGWGTRGTTP